MHFDFFEGGGGVGTRLLKFEGFADAKMWILSSCFLRLGVRDLGLIRLHAGFEALDSRLCRSGESGISESMVSCRVTNTQIVHTTNAICLDPATTL